MSIDPAPLPACTVDPSFGGVGVGAAGGAVERGVGSFDAGPAIVAERASLRGLIPGSDEGTASPASIPDVGRPTVEPLRSF